MSVMVRFSPKSMTAEQYDAILKKEIELGVHPVKGLEFEVCFGEGDQMKVSVAVSYTHLTLPTTPYV